MNLGKFTTIPHMYWLNEYDDLGYAGPGIKHTFAGVISYRGDLGSILEDIREENSAWFIRNEAGEMPFIHTGRLYIKAQYTRAKVLKDNYKHMAFVPNPTSEMTTTITVLSFIDVEAEIWTDSTIRNHAAPWTVYVVEGQREQPGWGEQFVFHSITT